MVTKKYRDFRLKTMSLRLTNNRFIKTFGFFLSSQMISVNEVIFVKRKYLE